MDQDTVLHLLYGLVVLWVARRQGRDKRWRAIALAAVVLSTLTVLVIDSMGGSPGSSGGRLSYEWPFAHPALGSNLALWAVLWALGLCVWVPRGKAGSK